MFLVFLCVNVGNNFITSKDLPGKVRLVSLYTEKDSFLRGEETVRRLCLCDVFCYSFRVRKESLESKKQFVSL